MIQTREQLAATLRDMVARVETGDSFQDHISHDDNDRAGKFSVAKCGAVIRNAFATIQAS